MLDHNQAETILSSTDVKRSEGVGMSRSKALAGDSEPKKPAKKETNVVEREMQMDRYTAVFSKVRDATYAAERACQKAKESVTTEKAMDRTLEDTLNDLIAVITDIRDERKKIIADAPENPLLRA